MTNPRLSLLRIAALALLVAGGIAWAWFGGRSYVAGKRNEAALALVDSRKPKAALELRATEDARLHDGPVPIEEAMHQLATRGRAGIGNALWPQPSHDTAPLMGWAFQPHDVPEWMMATPVDAGTAGPNAGSTR